MGDSDLHVLDQIAEEYLSRLRNGERPAVEEYFAKYPDHEESIRELFPTLEFMEAAGGNENACRGIPGDPLSTLESPSCLGDYRIVREVGRGGMGVVYEAQQLSLGRRVALKVLPASFARNHQYFLRFRREARSAGRLHHTNIVPVYEIGSAEGIHYYTMQFIEGRGLDQVIADVSRWQRTADREGASDSNRPPAKDHQAERESLLDSNADGTLHSDGSLSHSSSLDAIASHLLHQTFADPTPSDPTKPGSTNSNTRTNSRDKAGLAKSTGASVRVNSRATPHFFRNVARIGVQAADALAYAHAQKILHRDVKPANLLLDHDGNTWVTDFGLAKDEGESLTTTGTVMGTLRYLAPESLKGIYDARSDIYSLGFTLYELVTLLNRRAGTDPVLGFRPDSTRPLPRPRELDPRIPKDLETVIQKAMAHEASQRYRSAGELAEDLRRFLGERPILARPFTPLERVWMWTRRNPREATWLATLSLAFLLLLGGGLFNYFLRGERDAARTAAGKARDAELTANAAERDAQIRGHLARAIAERHSGQPGGRGRAVEQIRRAAHLQPTGDLRRQLQTQAIAALATPDVRIRRQKGQFDFADHAIACDRDHRYLAHMTADEAIVIRDTRNFKELRRIEAEGFPIDSNLQFSELGQFLAAHSHIDMEIGVVSVWRVDDGTLVYRSEGEKCKGVDISRDERWLSVCRDAKRVDIVDLESSESVQSIAGLTHNPRRALFSPDGDQILVGYGFASKRAEIYDRQNLTLSTPLHLAPEISLAMAWHPDGRRIAIAASFGENVSILDLNRGNLFELNLPSVIDEMEFHPTQPLLRTFSWDGTSRIWDLTSLRTAAILDESVTLATWSRHPPFLGYDFAAEHVDLVEWEPLAVFRSIETTSGYSNGSLSSGSGPAVGRLAVAKGDLGVEICDTATRTSLAQLNVASPLLAEIRGQSLWVVSHDGLAELPIQLNGAEAVIGPPQCHLPAQSWLQTSLTSDGSFFAATRDNPPSLDTWSLTIGNSEVKQTSASILLPENHNLIHLSADGRWAATGYWHDNEVAVWDLKSRTLAQSISGNKNALFQFLPGSRHLAISKGDAIRIYELETWNCVRTIERRDCSFGGSMAFSHDGQIAALETEPCVLELFDLATWETLLRLEHPGQSRVLLNPNFSADDQRLHVALQSPYIVGYWDLRGIRSALTDLKLAWDTRLNRLADDTEPPDSDSKPEPLDSVSMAEPLDSNSMPMPLNSDSMPEPVNSDSMPVPINSDSNPEPLKVRLVGLESWLPLNILAPATEEDASHRLEVVRQRHLANPTSAKAAADFSRELSLTVPSLRNPQLALELATKAQQQEPDDGSILIALALAQHRSGKFELVEQTLRDRLGSMDDATLPFAAYLLTLSVSAQGRADEAMTLLNFAQRADSARPYLFPDQIADLSRLAEEARTAIKPRPSSPPPSGPAPVEQ